MIPKLQYLLLQVRNSDDTMRFAEVTSFARGLRTDAEQISVHNLLTDVPDRGKLNKADVVLLGGSGHYSAAGEDPWLMNALDLLREICDMKKPTFASCWGFQAMARAMGGAVIHDPQNAEVGTKRLHTTPAGREDPIFCTLGDEFHGQMGHEDRASELPPDTTLLASSDTVTNQAYRFNDRPIYCTQFHPELCRGDLLERIQIYPEYIKRVAGVTIEQFGDTLLETPKSEALLPRFVEHFFGG